ncbi:MAG: cupin domain-containing protein [Hormoscilla sp. GM7CHS1pb]|nr:cupin domain-containing protein [Hormoscilla sp. GM7CHS1pb]UDF05918.1 DysE [Hormoscilla sp. GUM007]
MSVYFPIGKHIQVKSSVELLAFQCQDTVIQLATIYPGAIFDLHHHPESQMGMVFNRGLEINVDGKKVMLTPLEDVYVADANVPHGSVNTSSETVLCFDVKRIVQTDEPVSQKPGGSGKDKAGEAFLKLWPAKDAVTGFDRKLGTGSWFDVIMTQIPPGGEMPVKKSVRDRMGIILNSQMVMTVGEERQRIEYGKIYYVPIGSSYRGYNESSQEVCLIEIGI